MGGSYFRQGPRLAQRRPGAPKARDRLWLFETAVAYLGGEDAWRVQSYVPGDPEGSGSCRPGIQVDRPQPDLGARPAQGDRPRSQRWVPAVTLGETRDRAAELYAICVEGEIDMPSDEPATEMDFESWRRDRVRVSGRLGQVQRGRAGGEQPVSLAIVTADPERGVGYNWMTAARALIAGAGWRSWPRRHPLARPGKPGSNGW